MQQIKLFTGLENEPGALEAEVNSWIAQSGVKVLSITSNIAPQSMMPGTETANTLTGSGSPTRRFAPSDILVMVTYEKA